MIRRNWVSIRPELTLAATYRVLGAGGALYALGRLTHNDHLAETGRLGVEAIIDATLVSEALKLATNREQPDEETVPEDSGRTEPGLLG